MRYPAMSRESLQDTRYKLPLELPLVNRLFAGAHDQVPAGGPVADCLGAVSVACGSAPPLAGLLPGGMLRAAARLHAAGRRGLRYARRNWSLYCFQLRGISVLSLPTWFVRKCRWTKRMSSLDDLLWKRLQKDVRLSSLSQDFSNLALGLAHLGCQPPAEWAAAFQAASGPRLHTFPPQARFGLPLSSCAGLLSVSCSSRSSWRLHVFGNTRHWRFQ